MLKLSLFLLLAMVVLMPDDAAAWRRWRIRVRVPRLIRAARTAYTIYRVAKPFIGRDVHAADANLDAVVEARELTSMLGERATAEDVEELIRMADDNGDGKMTRRELEDFVRQLELDDIPMDH